MGAPRPTKMGTIVSLWRYDAGACRALQSAILKAYHLLRLIGIPDFGGVVRLPVDSGHVAQSRDQRLCPKPTGSLARLHRRRCKEFDPWARSV